MRLCVSAGPLRLGEKPDERVFAETQRFRRDAEDSCPEMRNGCSTCELQPFVSNPEPGYFLVTIVTLLSVPVNFRDGP